ncbi:YchJ family protein [Labrenzia suaedae]|uniref:YchJ family protein n=2 Tax=Roseibium litorale TaxID=2803841 RepID=A0ABR9CMZ4_9HYPH|nr:YchJ family protein [Roseibium litorale]
MTMDAAHASHAPCPCGSGEPIGTCCGPYLSGETVAPTAEALMRSRYSAYVCQKISYLKDTLWPKYQPGFDEAATAAWASESRWTGLKVLSTSGGQTADRDGTVLFEARYLSGAKLTTHRELSRFRKKAGRWYYVEALEEK